MPAPRLVSDQQIAEAIAQSGGNLSEASRLLGRSRSFLSNRGYAGRIEPKAIGAPTPPEPISDATTAKHYTDILKFAHEASGYRKGMDPSTDLGSIIVKSKGPIGVFLISDLHLGSPQCDYLTFIKHVDYLKRIPNLYAIVQGDVLEYAISQRMLDSVLSQNLSPQEQAQLWKQIVDDLADKLLAAVIGNHELRAERMGAFDVGLYMYQKLIAKKKAYMKSGGTLNISLGTQKYTWRITHGDSRFGSMYNPNHKNMQLSRMSFGTHRIQSSGHTHEGAIQVMNVPLPDGIGMREAVSLQAGSYKVIGGEQYPDRLGFGRVREVQMPMVILYPDEDCVLPFLKVEEGMKVLEAINAGKTPRPR